MCHPAPTSRCGTTSDTRMTVSKRTVMRRPTSLPFLSAQRTIDTHHPVRVTGSNQSCLGYVLPPPPGIAAARPTGDLRSVDVRAEVKGGKVVANPSPKRCKASCKRERDLQRELMHMERVSSLQSESVSVPGQYHNIGPRNAADRALRGVHVAALCLTNALRALSDRHCKFSDKIGTVSSDGKCVLQCVTGLLTTEMMQAALRSRVVDTIYERICCALKHYKSKKWSRDTFMTSLRSAGLDSGAASKKEVKVKPNEWASRNRAVLLRGAIVQS